MQFAFYERDYLLRCVSSLNSNKAADDDVRQR